jgi:hypothetical protein
MKSSEVLLLENEKNMYECKLKKERNKSIEKDKGMYFNKYLHDACS